MNFKLYECFYLSLSLRKRRPWFYLTSAYLYIFLIASLAFTLFAIDNKVPQGRIPAAFILLLTAFSFKWTLTSLTPSVSYMTSLDKYTIVCIFFICLTIVWHSIIATWWDPVYALFLDGILLLTFSGLFVIIHAYFITWFILSVGKIRNLRRKETKFFQLDETNSTLIS